jgi:hypothetical protein
MRKYQRVSDLSLRAITIGLYIAIFAHCSIAQTASSPAARIAKENLPSVVTLVALDDHDQTLALGSGFFISANGLVATNTHVVAGASKVILRWQGKSGTAKRILKLDPRFDLVILQTSFSATPTVKLGDSDLIAVGEEIVALGSPFGFEGTVSTGIISGIRQEDATRYLQITAPISPGSSGGPIFNTNGVVVGITTGSVDKGQNLNFALPTNLLNQLPDSDITFAAAKYASLDSGAAQGLRDLVFADNIIEDIWEDSNDLDSVTFSIQNKTSHTVCDLRVLVIMRNGKGEIINYHQSVESDCIAAGLAKQFTVSATAQGYRGGKCEIRIFDFRVKKDAESAFDNLLNKQ